MRHALAYLAGAALLVLSGSTPGVAEEPPAARAPDLRLVPVREGLLRAACRGDLERLPDTPIYGVAKRAGVDLRAPPHPLVVRQFAKGRLFYLFYKTAENAFGDRPYLIQRIQRTERTWKTPDAEPEETVTHQVEVFKMRGGAIKRPDQHHGSYGIHDLHRREIVKEYEIGFGEVPGLCEGTTWPFDPGRLFEYLQRYGQEGDVYDRVRFKAARRWQLTVSLDRDGVWRVASPELGFDLPDHPPSEAASAPKTVPASATVVLHAGRGPEGVRVGTTTVAELQELLGPPWQTTRVTAHSTNHHYANALTFNFDGSGRLNTVFTRPGFGGRTDAGVRHGDARAQVMEAMGVPKDQRADAQTWRYAGVLFWFDVTHKVSKIVVFAER